MAKKTIEELLKEALVPKGEQLYEVPENWVWSKLLEGGAECLDKFRKPINARERETRIGNIPYYGATGQVGWIDDYLTDEELVLVGEDGAPFYELLKNKAYTIEGKAWVNNHAHILKSYYGHYGNLYLMHYLNQFNYHGYVNGTTRLKLTQGNMKKIPIPISPLYEQERIVKKIESLFSKIDKSKELIEEAREEFENRKEAILEKAFRGELTASWRQEYIKPNTSLVNNITNMKSPEDMIPPFKIPRTWEYVELKEVCDFKSGYAFKSKDFIDKGIQVIRIGNLYDAKLDLIRNPVFLPESYDKDLVEKYSVKTGDILLSLTGTKYKRDYGNAVLLDIANPILLNQRILAITPKINIKYVFYYLKTENFRDVFFSSETGGVNQGNVSSNFVKTIPISLPPPEEQKEIVRILDNLLSFESKIEELTQLEDQIELLKKSILAKAFRGELGTNDPTEESAIELLKEVISEK